MNGIHKVVVATDFSAGSVHAVDRGVLLARAHGAPDLLHAFDPGAWRALQATVDARRLTGEVLSVGEGRAWAQVHGERWQVASAQPLQPGQRVRGTGLRGLTLDVRPDPEFQSQREGA